MPIGSGISNSKRSLESTRAIERVNSSCSKGLGKMPEKLIPFLQQDLGVSIEQIELALRHIQETPNQLPMILWQYGLINLEQLEKIFDWLEVLVN